jgi:hypothetical protein
VVVVRLTAEGPRCNREERSAGRPDQACPVETQRIVEQGCRDPARIRAGRGDPAMPQTILAEVEIEADKTNKTGKTARTAKRRTNRFPISITCRMRRR